MTLLSSSRLGCAAAFFLLVPALATAAVARHHSVQTSPFELAEEARQQLLAIPPAQRTVNDYSTVMDAYRLIYHGNPGDVHAPQAIFAVGTLLEDEGNTLHQPRWLTAAIGQLEFLRTQYPRSSLRIAALLTEAHIAAFDLHDARLARVKYAAFVEEYPASSHADEARAALADLRSGRTPVLPQQDALQEAAPPEAAALPSAAPVERQREPGTNAQSVSSLPAMAPTGVTTIPAAASSDGVRNGAVTRTERRAASAAASDHDAARTAASALGNALPEDSLPPPVITGPAHTRSGLAYVNGIRHWSTPNYTRVAIDLGDEVKYQAARVPNPDRIYFDLHGTRLTQDLVGKSFAVTDNGFLKRVRVAQYSNDVTRVVLDVSDVSEYTAFLLPNPYRLIIDIHGGKPKPASEASAAEGNPASMTAQTSAAAAPVAERAASHSDVAPGEPAAEARAVPGSTASAAGASREVAVLSQQPGQQKATAEPTSRPIAVVAKATDEAVSVTPHLRRTRSGATASPLAEPAHAAAPTADGERSLVRALGLKVGRIVIDPGHGGHDSGTLGVGGLMEKDVVLDVALRVGKLLHDRLGAEIIYTRSDDTFIPLETRTAIANKAEADLFLSIHANSSQDESARGVETYYLNFTSQPDALDVAARENAVSDQSVHQLADLVKKITLKDKLDESREFAADVDQSLYNGLRRGNEGLKDRGVKKAPFVVLIGANMPSILTEISFVTNPKDASELRSPEYRERVAESIYKGVARYESGLSGGQTLRLASAGKSTRPGE